MKGRNGSTSFLPLKNKGGLNNKMISEKCLIEEQAKYVYDKIESGDDLKVGKTVLQQRNSSLPKQVKEKEDINLYEKVLISDMNTIKNKLQMEQWSILSDNIVYVRSDSNDVMNGIDIKMVDYRDHRRMYRRMGKEEGERLNTYFGESPKVLRDKYMDVYEEVFAEVVTTNRFDENVDLSTTYLGKIHMRMEDIMKAEESFPTSEQGFVMGRMSNGEKCQILLDTGASKSYYVNNEAVSAADPIPFKPIPENARSEVLPPYLLLQNRPPPKPPDQLIKKQDVSDTKIDIEENSPLQENIISEIYAGPD